VYLANIYADINAYLCQCQDVWVCQACHHCTHLSILLLIYNYPSMMCVPANINAKAMPTCDSAKMSGSANPATTAHTCQACY
jgi:hypothetical protein